MGLGTPQSKGWENHPHTWQITSFARASIIFRWYGTLFLRKQSLIQSHCIEVLFPCWSVLDFWKFKLEKSSLTNWIFSLQKSISKLIFSGYTGSKNPVWNRLKIQFTKPPVDLFLIFEKSNWIFSLLRTGFLLPV